MTADDLLFAQSGEWELPELVGAEIQQVYGFVNGPDDSHPEKMFMKLTNGEVHSFFMSAGGHWRELDAETLDFEHQNYEESRIVDYTDRFDLAKRTINRVWSDWNPINVETSNGVLTLTEGDWDDPDAIDTIAFEKRVHPQDTAQAESGRGGRIAPATPPTPPGMRVRTGRFQ